MPKRVREPFRVDGGMKEIPDINALQPNEMNDIVNMEYKEETYLTKRLAPMTFDADLNTLIAKVFDITGSGEIKKIAQEPYYPSNLPSDISDDYDYFIPIYGYDGTYYYLYVFYKTDLGWIFGETIVINGDFGTDTDWTKGTGWTIASGVADCDGSQVGASILEPSSALTIVATTDYWLIATVTRTAGTLTPSIGGTNGTAITASGFVCERITTTNTNNLKFSADASFEGTVDNVMVIKECGYTQGIYDAGVAYTTASDLDFSLGSKRMGICDNVNVSHMLTINEDQDVISGVMGIPAPVKLPILTVMDEYDGNHFEETATESYMGDCSLVQVVYTVETDLGDESNPSPKSKTLDMQWFKMATDGSDERWLKNVQATNLHIPDDANDDLIEELKYFNIYIKIVRNSQGTVSGNFYKVLNVEIMSKTGANSYLISGAVLAAIASYDNDIAPVAKNICEIDNVTVLSNTQSKLLFPWSFKYYVAIKLNNENSQAIVDAVVRIRLWDKDSGDTDALTYFNINEYGDGTDLHASGSGAELLRIFDVDLTTPLPTCVIHADWSSATYMDVFIKVPQLEPNAVHTIYFCFTPVSESSTYPGATSDYQSYIYGKFHEIGIKGWTDQEVFNVSRVRDTGMSLCSPMNEVDWAATDEAPNKANMNIVGDLTDCALQTGGNVAFVKFDNLAACCFVKGYLLFEAGIDNKVVYENLGESDTGECIVRASVSFTTADLQEFNPGGGNNYYYNCLFGVYETEHTNDDDIVGWFLGLTYVPGTPTVYFRMSTSPDFATGATTYSFNAANELEMDALGALKLNIVLTLDDFDDGGNCDAHLFVQGSDGVIYVNTTKTVANIKPHAESEFLLGYDNWWEDNGGVTKLYPNSIPNICYEQVTYGTGYSISDFGSLYNIANFMPLFPSNHLGFQYVNGITAIDISFDTTLDTITSVAANPDFATLFANADYIRLDGSTSNDGYYTVSSLAGNVITVDENLTTEVAGDTVTIIGFKINQNLSFDDTEEIEYKSKKNAIVWSKPYGYAFPDNYIRFAKAPIIEHFPMPSFLITEHGKVILIGRRNGWEIFNVEGEASTWGTRDLIPEETQHGLIEKGTGIICGNTFIYPSEAGIIRWDSGNRKEIITRGIIDFLEYLDE